MIKFLCVFLAFVAIFYAVLAPQKEFVFEYALNASAELSYSVSPLDFFTIVGHNVEVDVYNMTNGFKNLHFSDGDNWLEKIGNWLKDFGTSLGDFFKNFGFLFIDVLAAPLVFIAAMSLTVYVIASYWLGLPSLPFDIPEVWSR